MPTPTQLETLRRHTCTGLRRAAERLRGRPGDALGFSVLHLRSLSLGAFPDGVLLPDGEDQTVVVRGATGALRGTALLALAPHDALRWIRASGDATDPLGRVAELGGTVLAEWWAALGRAFGVHVEPGGVALREEGLVAAVLETHAPPDTALLCARVAAALGEDDVGEGRSLPVCLVLLVEAKLLGSLLPSLGEG